VTRASALLEEARRLYDEEGSELPAHARRVRWRGFTGGAEWMAAAMARVGGTGPALDGRRWEAVGGCKYAVAVAAGLLSAAALAAAIPLAGGAGAVPVLAAAIAGFYLAEAPAVFLFPALLDGRPGWRTSLRLVRRDGGILSVAATTSRIALHMLSGGLRGQGFLRSWCVGCLAVVCWYERLRRR